MYLQFVSQPTSIKIYAKKLHWRRVLFISQSAVLSCLPLLHYGAYFRYDNQEPLKCQTQLLTASTLLPVWSAAPHPWPVLSGTHLWLWQRGSPLTFCLALWIFFGFDPTFHWVSIDYVKVTVLGPGQRKRRHTYWLKPLTPNVFNAKRRNVHRYKQGGCVVRFPILTLKVLWRQKNDSSLLRRSQETSQLKMGFFF